MLKYVLAFAVMMLETCSAQVVPFPDEKMESLFAGMREVDEARGSSAFAATIKLVKDYQGKIENLDYYYLNAINDSGQQITGFASVQSVSYWKIKLSSEGKEHYRYGSRHQLLLGVEKDQEPPFVVPSFDPISQTMRPINSVRVPTSAAKGWHYRRSAKHLEDFKEGKLFDLHYKEPGTGILKNKMSRYRFDQNPIPHVVQWDLRCLLKDGTAFDAASTATKWESMQDRYLPKTIHGTTSFPGDGPKYFGVIEVRWSFAVPRFDTDASDWVDLLAKSFSVDPFLESDDE